MAKKGFSLDIQGLTKLSMTIANAHPKAVEQSLKAVKNNTELLKAEAQSNAHVITRFMHDNIISRYEGVQGIVHSQAGYSGYEEFGTRFRDPHPFMRPALDFIYPYFQKDMTNVMKGAFK